MKSPAVELNSLLLIFSCYISQAWYKKIENIKEMKKIITTNRPVIFENLKMTQTKHFIDGVLRMFESDMCTKGYMDLSTIFSRSIHSKLLWETVWVVNLRPRVWIKHPWNYWYLVTKNKKCNKFYQQCLLSFRSNFKTSFE